MKRSLGELRIIGGEWRSRRVAFDADPAIGLRATPDRVRQTLFDWLQPDIAGAVCLDLFAGSGALGLEALSRGAAHCRFVDSGAAQVADIRAALALLKGEARAEVVRADALAWLQQQEPSFRRKPESSPARPALPDGLDTGLRRYDAGEGFDVIFLDPPFASNLLAQVLSLLPPHLKPGNRLYLEWQSDPPALPAGFRWLKEKKAGQVSYGLATFEG